MTIGRADGLFDGVQAIDDPSCEAPHGSGGRSARIVPSIKPEAAFVYDCRRQQAIQLRLQQVILVLFDARYGHDADATVVECDRVPVMRFVAKPLNANGLERVVRIST